MEMDQCYQELLDLLELFLFAEVEREDILCVPYYGREESFRWHVE